MHLLSLLKRRRLWQLEHLERLEREVRVNKRCTARKDELSGRNASPGVQDMVGIEAETVLQAGDESGAGTTGKEVRLSRREDEVGALRDDVGNSVEEVLQDADGKLKRREDGF
jgi:hypothetical protein